MANDGNGTIDASVVPQIEGSVPADGRGATVVFIDGGIAGAAVLAAGGAIGLYGCDVAGNASGVAFLDQVSQAIGGVAVDAASHLVGAAVDGGSWSLDVGVGPKVAAATPFTVAAQAAYGSVLAVSGN